MLCNEEDVAICSIHSTRSIRLDDGQKDKNQSDILLHHMEYVETNPLLQSDPDTKTILVIQSWPRLI